MIHKVLAYLTRRKNGRLQLLVFDHRHEPDAGTQVPAGTVEKGESVEAALFREIREESGLAESQLVRKLAEHQSREWGTVRHVFQLRAPETAPESWSHTVRGKGEDAGMVFDYYWVDVHSGLALAGNQHCWLEMLE